MFSVSNEIAYHGLMVYATPEEPFPGGGRKDYPGSGWIDVAGRTRVTRATANGGRTKAST
jgi:hypothetical protein